MYVAYRNMNKIQMAESANTIGQHRNFRHWISLF